MFSALVAIGLAAAVWGQESAQTEYLVKAAYLYNFGVYTEWPRPVDRFRIGVVGQNPFGTALEKLAKTKKVRERPIEILHFESPEDISDCEILFLADGQHLTNALERTKGKNVLIVGQEEGLGGKGAMFNFYLEEGKVKFEINRKSLESAGLKVDYRVLKLGKLVEDPTLGGRSRRSLPWDAKRAIASYTSMGRGAQWTSPAAETLL